MEEMEELIIEANIKQDEGPLRSVWEGAIERGRARENRNQNSLKPNGKASVSWEGEVMARRGEGRKSLPSLVSRSPSVGPVRLSSSTRHQQSIGNRMRRISC